MKSNSKLSEEQLTLNFLELFRNSKREKIPMEISQEPVQQLLKEILLSFNLLKSQSEKMVELGTSGYLSGSAKMVPEMDAELQELMTQGLSLNFVTHVFVNEKISSTYAMKSGIPPIHKVDEMVADSEKKLEELGKEISNDLKKKETEVRLLGIEVKEKLQALKRACGRGDKKAAVSILSGLLGRGVDWNTKIDVFKLYQTAEQIKQAAIFYDGFDMPSARIVISYMERIMKNSLVKERKGFNKKTGKPVARKFSEYFIPRGEYTGDLNIETIAEEMVRSKK